MNVLMVGVDKNRIGGMWSVAEIYINDKYYNEKVNLYYVATSTCGSKFRRVWKMITGYVKILWILMTKEIDILHIHMAERGSVFRKGVVIELAKKFNKKVVVQLHAGPFVDWYESIGTNEQDRVKKIINSADKVLVLGEYWREQLSKLVPVDKIDILYNGTNVPKINSYNPDGKEIVYLGLLKKTKGTYDLVDAIKIIDERLPRDTKVYLCGDDEDNSFPKYISDRNLNNRFILTGWISKEQIRELFKRTAVVVLPSYFEALSMTVIEAMAYGIPVVTTDISTMGELLGDKIERVKPGDIEALASLILKVYSNRDLRVEESQIEYKRAEEYFSSGAMINSTLRIYNKILS